MSTTVRTVEEQPEPEYEEMVEFMGWKIPVLVDVSYSSGTSVEEKNNE